MQWTGERFIPGVAGEVEVEHLHRYVVARALAANMDVLDIACGEGYGTNLLAETARSAWGVDLSNEAVNHASATYSQQNLRFIRGDCTAIPFNDASFDCVVSYETIEHHENHETMIREICRVLRPGGLLIMSSPDRLNYSDRTGNINRFHVKELYREEFQNLLTKYFRHLRMYGQRVLFGSYIAPIDNHSDHSFYTMSGHAEELHVDTGLPDPFYDIALASDSDLPQLPCGVFHNTKDLLASVFATRNEKLLSEIRLLRNRQSQIKSVGYCLGSKIDFSEGGNSPLYMMEGWGATEKNGTWATDGRSTIRLRLFQTVESKLVWKTILRPFVPPGSAPIKLEVRSKGKCLDRWELANAKFENLEAEIPRECATPDGCLELEFIVANPRSPKELGRSNDMRLLGIFVKEMLVCS